MPSLRQLIQSKANRLDIVPDRLVDRAIAVQPQLFDTVLGVLAQMDITEGNFDITTKNLDLINQAIEEVRTTLLGSDYINAVGEYSREFDTQKKITDEALGGTSDIANTLLATSKAKAVDKLVKVEFVNTGLYDPIRSFLDGAVSNGSSLSGTIKDLRAFIIGGTIDNVERIGLLDRYAKQIAFDAFAQADRQYTTTLGDELELEWYFYAGGLIKPDKTGTGTPVGGTRDFCKKRNEQYWHYKEIESWASEDWAGKVKGTSKESIFQFLGGWNCRHILMPVSEAIVPKKRLQDAIAKGYYKPNEQTRNLLNL